MASGLWVGLESKSAPVSIGTFQFIQSKPTGESNGIKQVKNCRFDINV